MSYFESKAFYKNKVTNTTYRDATFARADMRFVRFENCEFFDCDFEDSMMQYATLTHCNFKQCNMNNVMLANSMLTGVDMRECNLSNMILSHSALDKCTFHASNRIAHIAGDGKYFRTVQMGLHECVLTPETLCVNEKQAPWDFQRWKGLDKGFYDELYNKRPVL